MLSSATSPGISVRPLSDARDRRELLELPARLHADDPVWVRPLDSQRRSLWSPRNAWFAHARAAAWLARRGERVVGSISAQVDELHRQVHGETVGYFGQLAAEDDPEVFTLLLAAACEWLVAEGCQKIRGPFDLGVNQSCGLLVDGFDSPPMIMMNHGKPYYSARLEDCGLRGAMDLLAYSVAPDFAAPPAMRRLVARSGSRLRPMDDSRYRQDLEVLRELFNDAWAGNWGFVPFTAAEFRQLGREMKPLLKRDYVQIAEIDGEPVGFILALPNMNELIRDLDGRLMPFGWLRLLWRLKRDRASTARVPLMGIRRRFHSGPLGAALAFQLIDAVRQPLIRNNVRLVEMSWILRSNRGMRSMIEAIGGREYKRYRIYEAELPHEFPGA